LQERGVKSQWLEKALAYKTGVVHRDPKEAGERRLLNLGHTLGHALESASGYALLHGEAVGLGLLAACLLSEEQGLKPFPPAFLAALAARLAPLAPLVAPWSACLPLLARDKKARRGAGDALEIHCILPRHGDVAQQRLLPPEAWERSHARMRTLLLESARG
jgi:3-dehydroquinate synthase